MATIDYKAKKVKMIEYIYKRDQGRRWSKGMLTAYTFNDLTNIVSSYKELDRKKRAAAKAKKTGKNSWDR